MSKKHNTRTNLVHAGSRRSQYGEISEAIFLTQGYAYATAEAAEARFVECGDDEYIYARYSNPTVRMFEERIATLEGAEDAFATASGMAAVNGVLFSQLKAGDHVVSAKALFGSCLHILETLLPRYGVEVTFVDGTDLNAWRDAVQENTKLVFAEAISNPTLEVIDISGVAEIAHSVGAIFVVDNVFVTPIFQRTLALGADVVVYSATKHIDGQGRCLGGVVLGSKDFINGDFQTYMRHTGGALSPFNAWVMLKSLETLHLRCHAQADNALAVANSLEGHPHLSKVIYPALESHPQKTIAAKQMDKGGTIVAFEIKGGRDAAFKFMNALEIVLLSNNLGDTKTLITHPATTTHKRLSDEQKQDLGISDGLVRLSIGIEDVEDIKDDINQALKILN